MLQILICGANIRDGFAVPGILPARNIIIDQECGKTVTEELLQKKSRIMGAKIKYYRTMKGTTQMPLAKKLGISNQYLSRIECGKRAPSLPLLLDIAQTLGVDVTRLVSDDR